MKVLITGGAGYIGSHAAVELIKEGHDIVILDNLSNSAPGALERIKEITGADFPFYAVDITHKQGLERIFKNEKIDAVMHFAGLKCVPESVKNPMMYFRNNVEGTLNLTDVMSVHNCCKLVFSSSATVYALSQEPPYREDFATGANNPYGSSKLIIETILKDLQKSDDRWRIALLRYFNPIGAHESGKIGDDPTGIPNNLVPYIQRVAAGILPHVNITGDDYDTPDGTGIRDYIHVTDLAAGHAAALNYLQEHVGCNAINLGTGKGSSVLEVIAAFEAANGVKIPYKVAPRRPGDVAVSYANVSKAKELLDWEASLTLEDMCRDAWNFQKNRGKHL